MGTMVATVTGLALTAAAMVMAPQPSAAQDSPEPDPRIICPWLVSEGRFRNHGDCMNGYRMGSQAFCMRLEKSMLEVLGYRNQGECVARMRELDRRR